MAMSINIVGNIVYVKAQGVVSDKHVLNTLKMRLSHPNDRQGLQVFCDMSEVEENTVTEFGLKMLADIELENAQWYFNCHVAIVAVDEKTVALVDRYKMFSSELPRQLEVFASHMEAARWLNAMAA